MITLPGSMARCCEGVTRREWLQAGAIGTFGLTLSELLGSQARAAPLANATGSFGRARACIVVFLFGAPAHQDIWDLKPHAPSAVRGEFSSIASSVPGIRLGEHIPLIARQANRLTLIRSVTHPDNTHTVAMHYMLTGHRHPEPQTNPRNKPTDFPTFGAVMQYLQPGRALPSGISLNAPANQVSAGNHIFPGFFAGFLGKAYDPLFVSQDPSHDPFQPFPNLEAASVPRYAERRGLLAEVDRQRRDLDRAARLRQHDADYQKAFDLITSPGTRKAFDLSRESARVRDRYGRTAFGQGLLLARRLVEAGVRLVTVNWGRDDAFWDTHADNFRQLKNSLLPPFDRGFSALLEDLAQRGLLAETLVVCLGEFGRSPAINAQAGRDHWAACNTVVLAGGGTGEGRVHGASDRLAAYPARDPVSPSDLSATIYYALGVEHSLTIRDHLGRIWPLAPGRPLTSLFT
jgi:Protein of unknown function (DUF1501)